MSLGMMEASFLGASQNPPYVSLPLAGFNLYPFAISYFLKTTIISIVNSVSHSTEFSNLGVAVGNPEFTAC